MPATLTIHDETTSGQRNHTFTLEFPSERITVRELIRERIYQEVDDHNRNSRDVYHGLIQPTDAEATLNGFRLRQVRQIDWKAQFDKAIEAFEANRILVLINDHQAASLDEAIEITRGTEVTFLRLVMLVGG